MVPKTAAGLYQIGIGVGIETVTGVEIISYRTGVGISIRLHRGCSRAMTVISIGAVPTDDDFEVC